GDMAGLRARLRSARARRPAPRDRAGAGGRRRRRRDRRPGRRPGATLNAVDTLFEPPEEPRRDAAPPDAPLAARMRPLDLDDVVGQEHLLAPGSALRRAIE